VKGQLLQALIWRPGSSDLWNSKGTFASSSVWPIAFQPLMAGALQRAEASKSAAKERRALMTLRRKSAMQLAHALA